MDDIQIIMNAAYEAGAIGLHYFKQNPEHWIKGKNSPVTEADIAIDRYLHKTLLEARPEAGWLSEESEDTLCRLSRSKTFIVDPIDGTRGFIAGSENWLISIAMIEAGRPQIGVLYVPVLDKLYVAQKGKGAQLNGNTIAASTARDLSQGAVIIPERVADIIGSSLDHKIKRAPHIHSLAYRIALVADGTYSAALARPGACDWDIAAADLILTEAGGRFTTLDGEQCVYNMRNTRHEWLLSSGKFVQKNWQSVLQTAING